MQQPRQDPAKIKTFLSKFVGFVVLFQVQLLFWDVFESQEMWSERHSEEEWMCWCREVNIQYPRVTVLHAWITLSEQEQGRYRTGQEGVESKTGNRNTERKIKGCETPAREVVLENYFYLFIQPLNSVTLSGDAEHAGGAVEDWRCVSATWSSDLQQSCRVLKCFCLFVCLLSLFCIKADVSFGWHTSNTDDAS